MLDHAIVIVDVPDCRSKLFHVDVLLRGAGNDVMNLAAMAICVRAGCGKCTPVRIPDDVNVQGGRPLEDG